jgi:hypothetical protein
VQTDVPDLRVFFELRGFLLAGGTPLPRGYFGGKLLEFSSLRVVSVRKILNANGLWLKYLLSTGWPLGSPGASLFLIYVFIIAN